MRRNLLNPRPARRRVTAACPAATKRIAGRGGSPTAGGEEERAEGRRSLHQRQPPRAETRRGDFLGGIAARAAIHSARQKWIQNDIPAAKEEPAANPPETQEDKARTRDYWQERFKAARRDVAKAKEHEQLSEDELSLLQIRQVRELDPIAKDDLSAEVQAKQSEVDVNKVATDAAEKALDDLTKEFEASSAP